MLLCIYVACDSGDSERGKPDPDPGKDAAERADAGPERDSGEARDAMAMDARVTDSDAHMGAAGDGDDDDDGGAGNDPSKVGPLCVDCRSSEKLCEGLCVRREDPALGCAAKDCQPCSLAHAFHACDSQGGCAIKTCEAGWADCDGNDANGCEADLSKPATCGGCGAQHACDGPAALCSAAGCTGSCDPPLTLCGMRCVDLTTSTQACGSCNMACGGDPNGNPTCKSAVCGRKCNAGITQCGNHCVDLTRTASACGACDHACEEGQACAESKCVPAPCQGGWTNCGGTCVAMQADADNCGTCGNVCGANDTCVAGKCVATSSQWLHTSLTNPSELVLDSTDLYWIDRSDTDGAVKASSKSGGPVRILASGQHRPQSLVLDGSYAYWANNLGGAIMRAPKDGSAAASVVATATSPAIVAVDASYLYVPGAPGTGKIDRVSKTGGPLSEFTSIPVTPAPTVQAMLIDTSGLYVASLYARDWRLWRIDRNTGDATELYPGEGGFVTMATDATHLYFADSYDQNTFRGIGWVDKTTGGTMPNRILTKPLTTLVPADCGVFWTDGMDLYLSRAARPLAVALAHGEISDLAVDETTVFWTDGTGKIGKISRL